MGFTVNVKSVKEALVGLGRVVQRNAKLPVLSSVRISGTGNGKISLTVTDLDEWLSCVISEAKGNANTFLINFSELKEFMRNVGSSGNVTFEEFTGEVRVTADSCGLISTRTFSKIADNIWMEMPPVPENDGSVAPDVFSKIALAIPFAAGDKDSRPYLRSVNLEPEAAVATDGKKLVKLACATGLKKSIPVPVTKVLSSGMLAGFDGKITEITGNGNRFCLISTDKWQYAVKCHGTYPNYKCVIPPETSGKVIFNTEEMDRLLKEVPPLTIVDPEYKAVHLYASEDNVSVFSDNLDDFIKAGKYSGKDSKMSLSFNREMLMDAFSLGFTTINFNACGPVLVNGRSDESIMVYMPLRNGQEVETLEKAMKKKPVSQVPVIENNQTVQPQNKEAKMPEENKVSNDNGTDAIKPANAPNGNGSGFRVVGSEQPDPLDELLREIAVMRDKTREMADTASTLAKLVKDAQRAQKQKEREFRNTTDILDKLRKVSGF